MSSLFNYIYSDSNLGGVKYGKYIYNSRDCIHVVNYYDDKYILNELSYSQHNGRRVLLIEYDKYGNKHGKFMEWHINGQKIFDMTYDHGIKHGVCREWFYNGIVKHEVTYSNGMKIGREYGRLENGMLLYNNYW